jgi:hypothetical protein
MPKQDRYGRAMPEHKFPLKRHAVRIAGGNGRDLALVQDLHRKRARLFGPIT